MLLEKIKSKISELDYWTDKQETKAEIDTLIFISAELLKVDCVDDIAKCASGDTICKRRSSS